MLLAWLWCVDGLWLVMHIGLFVDMSRLLLPIGGWPLVVW